MAKKFLFAIALVLGVVAFGPGAQVKADSVLPPATDTGEPGNLPSPALGPGNLPSAARGPVVIPNSFIVQVEPGADPRGIANAVARATGGTVRYVYSHALSGFSLQVPPGIAIAAIMGADPSVLKVEPNLMARMSKKCASPPCNGGGGGGGGGGNGGPEAVDDSAVTDTGITIIIDVMANDSGKRLRVSTADNPTFLGGKAERSGDGKMVVYTAPGTSGNDSFGYSIVDKDGNPASAMVFVTVNGAGPANNPPQAVNDNGATDEDTTLNVDASGVLANDTDADGPDSLAVTAFDAVSAMGAAVNVEPDGSYSYDPSASAALNGLSAGVPADDTFTYTVSDGVDTDIGTVTVTVTGVNDPLTAVDDTEATDYDAVLNVAAPGVLGNDTDPDASDILRVTAFDAVSAQGADVNVDANGSYSYDPTASVALAALAEGAWVDDTFGYTVSDDNGDSKSATVTVTVTHPVPSTQVTDWGIERTGAASPPGDIDCSTIKIAILDTGIDLDHPDLNVDVPMSKDFTGIGSPDDDNGHGSHVGGIAGAKDNAIGVVGVCPGASLIAYKVLNSEGIGDFGGIIAAIDQVTAEVIAVPGVISVVNMSFGGQGFLDALRVSIQGLVDSGVVVAVSAGNASEDVYGPNGTFEASEADFDPFSCLIGHILCDDDFIPAAYPEAAAIAAMADYDGLPGGLVAEPVSIEFIKDFLYINQYDDTLVVFSNHNHDPDFEVSLFLNPSPGGAIDVAAPGLQIYSTYMDGGYATLSGTSMSSPHYAGAVARYVARNGRDVDGTAGIDGEDVKFIRQALIDLAESQYDWRSGPLPESFIAGIEDDCRPVTRPDTEDIDCNFEPLVDVGAIDLAP